MVLESWEGTHNVLVAQVLRDSERLGLHLAFIDEHEEAIARLELDSAHAPRRDTLRAGIAALRGLEPPLDQRFGKKIVDQMAIVQAAAAMLEELASFPQDRALAAAFDFITARDLKTTLERPRPLDPALA